jgi:hypothetical protein
MDSPIIASEGGITLAGGAPFGAALLREALGYAPRLVAADGGADRLLRLGHMPEIAIGDFDSISAAARETLGADRLHHIPEQDTTDFDKALRSVTAPFVLGLGFTGARIDHGLAVLNALGRHSGRPRSGRTRAPAARRHAAFTFSAGRGPGRERGSALADRRCGLSPAWPDRHIQPREHARGAAFL